MSERALDLFLLDLAGTAVRDDGDVREAFVRCAREAGLPVDEDRLRARMGWHKQAVFEAWLRDAGRDVAPAAAIAARFEHHYAAVVRERGLEPTPGARGAIAALLDAGIGIAFTTGFSRATADLVLATVGWSGFASVASTEVARGRPAPDLIREAMRRTGHRDPARAGTAGDTPADLAAGRAAGCRVVVGVGCGTHALADLEASPHTHLLPDLRPLPELVAGL
ncbi:MAG: HAD hydrolase-like protein [Planctomycetes bacterium]|nr:HAD hydrolase-like protein [Planctomycetota bacterium]